MASISGLLYLLYVLYARLFTHSFEPGWASIVSAVLILGGIQLLCIGLLGEYLALVFEESKHRPLYVVRVASTQNLRTSKDINPSKQASNTY
jgi:dolichol-phosphate mannosyltransferase